MKLHPEIETRVDDSRVAETVKEGGRQTAEAQSSPSKLFKTLRDETIILRKLPCGLWYAFWLTTTGHNRCY